MKHALRIAGICVLIIALMAYPFLPGRYDALGMQLGMLAGFLAFVSPIFIPLGLAWAIAGRKWRGARTRYWFGIAALTLASLVGALMLLAGSFEIRSFSVAGLLLGAAGVRRAIRHLRAERLVAPQGPSAVPLYLVVIPIVVAGMRMLIADPLTEWSRRTAIRNSAAMIADIERHRVANGRYPLSAVALHPDYWPSVIGIRQYIYEPQGDSYNLMFESPSFVIGTQEVVIYNPRNRQAIASHAMDVLQLSPEALALDRSRGHYATGDAGAPHWRYYLFD
jgi:hypothetical protein